MPVAELQGLFGNIVGREIKQAFGLNIPFPRFGKEADTA